MLFCGTPNSVFTSWFILFIYLDRDYAQYTLALNITAVVCQVVALV